MIDATLISSAPRAGDDVSNRTQSLEWVSDLASWKLSAERAERLNRNLIQYAASIAAALGISTGSGGVFALAQAVAQKTSEVNIFLIGFILAVNVIAAAMTIVLVALLASTYHARERAEHDAAEHLKALITAKPDHFLSESK